MWLTVMITTLAAIWGTGQHLAFREVTPPSVNEYDPITSSLRELKSTLSEIDTRVANLGG